MRSYLFNGFLWTKLVFCDHCSTNTQNCCLTRISVSSASLSCSERKGPPTSQGRGGGGRAAQLGGGLRRAAWISLEKRSREYEGRASHFQGPGGCGVTNKKYTRQAWARMRSPREGGRAGLWALCADGSALHAMPTRAWPCSMLVSLRLRGRRRPPSRALGRWSDRPHRPP